jgi:hypothetical protein
MRKILLPFLASAAFMATACLPAAAHERGRLVFQPYVIEKTCEHDGHECVSRMDYAPGHHAGRNGSGSYWYRQVSQVDFFKFDAKHVKWCYARYRSYNDDNNSFVGKNNKRYRCDSPYDGI